MTTDELKNKFENFKTDDDKWLFLLSLAKENKCTENIREDKWLIQGCSSKIWLKPSYVNNRLQFEVDGGYGSLSRGHHAAGDAARQDDIPRADPVCGKHEKEILAHIQHKTVAVGQPF